MKKYQIVIDTNVIVSALLSQKGSSFKLIDILDETNKFEFNISVPLFYEYVYALKKISDDYERIEKFLSYLCNLANQIDIHYLFRTIIMLNFS